MDYLINDEIEKLISNKKEDLIKIGYEINDENFDYITEGFIKIANSMLDNYTPEISNIRLSKIFSKYLDFETRFSTSYGEELLTKLEFKKYGKSFQSKIGYDFDEIKENKLIYANLIDNKCKFFIYLAKKINLRQFWEYKYIKEDIINDKTLLSQYNKGLLSKSEEKVISFILNDKEKDIEPILLSYKNNERYLELKEINRSYIIRVKVLENADYNELTNLFYKCKEAFKKSLEKIEIDEDLKLEVLKKSYFLLFNDISLLKEKYSRIFNGKILNTTKDIQKKYNKEIDYIKKLENSYIKEVYIKYSGKDKTIKFKEEQEKDYIEVYYIPLSDLSDQEKSKHIIEEKDFKILKEKDENEKISLILKVYNKENYQKLRNIHNKFYNKIKELLIELNIENTLSKNILNNIKGGFIDPSFKKDYIDFYKHDISFKEYILLKKSIYSLEKAFEDELYEFFEIEKNKVGTIKKIYTLKELSDSNFDKSYISIDKLTDEEKNKIDKNFISKGLQKGFIKHKKEYVKVYNDEDYNLMKNIYDNFYNKTLDYLNKLKISIDIKRNILDNLDNISDYLFFNQETLKHNIKDIIKFKDGIIEIEDEMKSDLIKYYELKNKYIKIAEKIDNIYFYGINSFEKENISLNEFLKQEKAEKIKEILNKKPSHFDKIGTQKNNNKIIKVYDDNDYFIMERIFNKHYFLIEDYLDSKNINNDLKISILENIEDISGYLFKTNLNIENIIGFKDEILEIEKSIKEDLIKYRKLKSKYIKIYILNELTGKEKNNNIFKKYYISLSDLKNKINN